MNLLKINGLNIEVNPQALMIKEFRRIWESASSESEAKEDLAIVYYYAHYKSEYSHWPEPVRFKEIGFDIKGIKEYRPSIYIKSAAKKFAELQNTPSMNFLIESKETANALSEYYRLLRNELVIDGVPNLDLDASKITKALKDTVAIVKNIESLEDKIKNEMEEKEQVTGGTEKFDYEDPDDMKRIVGL